MCWGLTTKYRKDIIPKKKTELSLPSAESTAGASTDAEQEPPPPKKRVSWARLLKRVFNIDINICSKCSGKIKIIAAIEDPKVIKQILEHLGLAATAPRLMQARGPPQADQSDFFALEFFED